MLNEEDHASGKTPSSPAPLSVQPCDAGHGCESLPRPLLSLQLGRGERVPEGPSCRGAAWLAGEKVHRELSPEPPKGGVRTPAHTVGSPTCPRAGCNQDFPPRPPSLALPRLLVSGADVRAIAVTSWSQGPCVCPPLPPAPGPTSPGGTQSPAHSLPGADTASATGGPLCHPRDPQSHFQPLRSPPTMQGPGPGMEPLAQHFPWPPPSAGVGGESRQDQLAFRVRAPADSSSSAQFTALFPVTNSAWR